MAKIRNLKQRSNTCTNGDAYLNCRHIRACTAANRRHAPRHAPCACSTVHTTMSTQACPCPCTHLKRCLVVSPLKKLEIVVSPSRAEVTPVMGPRVRQKGLVVQLFPIQGLTFLSQVPYGQMTTLISCAHVVPLSGRGTHHIQVHEQPSLCRSTHFIATCGLPRPEIVQHNLQRRMCGAPACLFVQPDLRSGGATIGPGEKGTRDRHVCVGAYGRGSAGPVLRHGRAYARLSCDKRPLGRSQHDAVPQSFV